MDGRSPTIFSIPKNWLIDTSSYFHRHCSSHLIDFINEPDKRIVWLPEVYIAHFFDFNHWLHKNRILPTLHMYVPYAIEHNARRLIDAIALDIALESGEYQYAAMKEFLPLARCLDWPEDHVNSVFDITKDAACMGKPHAARRMIVAIIAAKTVGRGKRKVRQGSRDRNIERGDRVEGNEFWGMFDWYVKQRGPECRYPDSVEEFL